MKKLFILKSTGKPVKIGDVIETQFSKTYKDGTHIEGIRRELLTEETVDKLIKKGIITVQTFGTEEEKAKDMIPSHVKYYLDKFVCKCISNNALIHYPPLVIKGVLKSIFNYSPSVLMSIILKEIALELDSRYTGTINTSPEIWILSVMDGKVYKARKDIIKNYRNFAAFRTEDDALFAKKVIKDIHRVCFDGHK